MNQKKNYTESFPMDIATALKALDNDEIFLKELLDMFKTDFKSHLEILNQAINDKNFEDIYSLGHKLKGSAAALYLNQLREYAFEMEQAGKEDDIEKAKKNLALMSQEFDALLTFLSQNKL